MLNYLRKYWVNMWLWLRLYFERWWIMIMLFIFRLFVYFLYFTLIDWSVILVLYFRYFFMRFRLKWLLIVLLSDLFMFFSFYFWLCRWKLNFCHFCWFCHSLRGYDKLLSLLNSSSKLITSFSLFYCLILLHITLSINII